MGREPLTPALALGFALGFVVTGCLGGNPGVDAGSAEPDAGPAALQFLSIIEDVADIELVRGANGAVKYLAQVAGAEITAPILAGCEFQNTTLYPFHLPFLLAQPGGEGLTFDAYVARVIRRETRVWWGGEIVWLPSMEHPLTGAPGTLAWAVYTEDSANNRLTLDDVRAGNARLAPCLPAFAGQLAFAPSSNEQTQTAQAIQAVLAADGIAVLLP
jgi:hypothetical protein